jgi:hypothetical protein
MIFVDNRFGLIKNVISVLFAFKTWVGLSNTAGIAVKSPIRPGILTPTDAVGTSIIDSSVVTRLNQIYARDYDPSKDFKIIFGSLKCLGR